jgi:putative DNA methylase
VTETQQRKRKLIEVALPLDEISAAAKADKAVKTGTIRNLHKWFAPMPLPAWRALLFAALIDDPDEDNQRVYLLDVIKRLVANGASLPDPETVSEAQMLLHRQFPDGLPSVLDPFCGGGSTLVEAQRLGMRTHGSDLNPVPLLITRALTEVLPKVHGQQPLHPHRSGSAGRLPTLFSGGEKQALAAYEGLVSDFLHYAEVVRDKAAESLKSYFPSPAGESQVAWLWARTANCPNPACGIETVLSTSWWLSKKKGDLAWVQPRVVEGKVELDVVTKQSSGTAPTPPKIGRGASFSCLACASLVDESEVIDQGLQGRLGLRLVSVVAEKAGQRVYRHPTQEEVEALSSVPPVDDFPEVSLPDIPRWFSGPRFGFKSQKDLYTSRQLLTLATFADAVAAIHETIQDDGGTKEWADAVATLLGLAVGKMAQYGSTQAFLFTRNGPSAAKAAFGRADMPMMWDFVETAPLGNSIGSWSMICTNLLRAIPYAAAGEGLTKREDARSASIPSSPGLVATDPPYFDAIGYADLSDYFYLWHRRALRNVHPDLYTTIAVPKAGELTAVPLHHGNDKDAARAYFIEGFTRTFENLKKSLAQDLPMLVVYASKEQKGGREEETRWSSILTAIVDAEMEITGTWPVHGTTEKRMISAGTNAVASYIVMVCRPRSERAATCSLADFNRALRRELGSAVRDLQAASILPVDLNQAALGPGMQIYSRYRAVLDQAGGRVPVEHALRLINAALGEVLEEQEGELDSNSRFAVRWWDTHGWEAASFGEADKAARPLGISVDEAVRAGVVASKANKVQLLGRVGLDRSWTPSEDARPTAWEAVHHLADRLIDGGGELEAASLMSALSSNLQDSTRALVYRLHDIAAKKGRTTDQERYNALINSWAELVRLSANVSPITGGLF